MSQNPLQDRQDQTPCEILIEGLDWREILKEEVELSEGGAAFYGAPKAPYIDLLRKESEVNRVSFERAVVSTLLTMGYKLKELVIELNQEDKAGWGVCIWYPEHEAYAQPIHDIFKDANLDPRFYHAMFKTEHAGDQRFCIYSTQMGYGILLHKTMVFRRVVLAPPSGTASAAA